MSSLKETSDQKVFFSQLFENTGKIFNYNFNSHI